MRTSTGIVSRRQRSSTRHIAATRAGASASRRRSFFGLLAAFATAACSGGSDGGIEPGGPTITRFDADRATYFVGERARLTATYTGGTGRIEPGNIAIASGQTIETPALPARSTFRLIVAGGGRTVQRERELDVRYRERLRTIAMPFARAEHVAVALDDGSALIVGGEESGSTLPTGVWRFEPATEAFAPYAQLATGRIGHVVVPLANGKVLVCGGVRGLANSPIAELIDRATRTVRPTNFQPAASRVYASATPLADGRVLLVGGGGGSQSGAEIFDPATERFTPVADPTTPRYAHTATRLPDGRVLVYGGFPAAGGSAALPVEIFEPASSRFVTLPSPEPGQRGLHAAIDAQDGSVWIVGGEDADARPRATVWRFDAAANRFERLADLLTARTFASALRLTDARLLVAGGETTAPGFGTSLTELLTPNGLRVAGPPLASSRVLHSVTRLATTGKVLVVGGLDPAMRIVPTAEVFE